MGLTKGLVQVYTGDGKGKTTAAFGQALRATGRGLKVAVLQFLKGRETGEMLALTRYLPQINIWRFGTERFIIGREATPEEKEVVLAGLGKALEAASSGEFDVVILDEISHAVNLGLVPSSEVLRVIDRKRGSTELILTGRQMPEEIIRRADLVTEMREIKHPYHRGIQAREGIEF